MLALIQNGSTETSKGTGAAAKDKRLPANTAVFASMCCGVVYNAVADLCALCSVLSCAKDAMLCGAAAT